MSDLLGLSAELRKADKKQQQKLRTLLYSLDWIKILDEAIKLRPSSWNSNPVREMTEHEIKAEGWDKGTTAVEFDDGRVIYASRDTEGVKK